MARPIMPLQNSLGLPRVFQFLVSIGPRSAPRPDEASCDHALLVSRSWLARSFQRWNKMSGPLLHGAADRATAAAGLQSLLGARHSSGAFMTHERH